MHQRDGTIGQAKTGKGGRVITRPTKRKSQDRISRMGATRKQDANLESWQKPTHNKLTIYNTLSLLLCLCSEGLKTVLTQGLALGPRKVELEML